MKTLKKWMTCSVVAAAMGLTSVSYGQDQNADNGGGTDPGYQAAVRYPDRGFTFMHHASTAREGALRGAADLVRSLGAANLDNSLAAMNYQEAYRRSLENTLKYAETYYAKRDLWFDYKEATRRKPLTMEGYRKLAEAKGADRLTPEQYDPETGNVRWPDLLMADILEPYRAKVDEALSMRSSTEAGLGSRTYEVVRQMTASMQLVLDKYREDVPTHLYVHSSKFLESVLLEARFNEPAHAEVTDADDAGPVDAAGPADVGAPAAEASDATSADVPAAGAEDTSDNS